MRGLGANLIKYVATAVVVMNYHAVFTTVNQGFVNAGNWISSASGGLNLLDNWRTDIQTQFSQIGFQNLWGLVTGSAAGLIASQCWSRRQRRKCLSGSGMACAQRR